MINEANCAWLVILALVLFSLAIMAGTADASLWMEDRWKEWKDPT